MSNLRLLSEHSTSGVNNISVTNVFTDEYDTYKIVFYDMDQSGAGGSHNNTRFLDVNGAQVEEAIYDYAQSQIKSYSSFGVDDYFNQSYFRVLGQITGSSAVGAGAAIYIFNPTNENEYTMAIGQSVGFYEGAGFLGGKSIACLKQTSKITGIKFYTNTTSTTYESIKFRIYGVRKD